MKNGRPSPYLQVNLWRNPFGELSRAERAELAVVDCETWLTFLHGPRSVVQFVGPCGHGKSTHLLALHAALPDSTYVYLPIDGPLPKIGYERPLILDEAQRLRLFERRRLVVADGPLVIGTHVDLASKFERAGWDILTVNLEQGPGSEKLKKILNRRIEASRIRPGPIPRVPHSIAVRLLQTFGNDVRAIEHYLYDCFQEFVQGKSSWPPAI